MLSRSWTEMETHITEEIFVIPIKKVYLKVSLSYNYRLHLNSYIFFCIVTECGGRICLHFSQVARSCPCFRALVVDFDKLITCSQSHISHQAVRSHC